VPARTGDDTRVFLVDPAAAGVTRSAQRLSTGEPVFTVTLAGVRVGADDVLAGGTAASYPGGNYFPSVTMLVSKSKGVPEAQDSRRDVAEHLVQPRRGAPVGEADARAH